jgi:MSHA pilin protein MshA
MLELIVAAAILVVLAAVALPRFADVQRDARITKLNAARDAVAAAIEQTHSAVAKGQWQAQCRGNNLGDKLPGIDALGNGSICIDQGQVQIAHSYPAATVAGVVVAAGLAQPLASTDAGSLVTDGYQAVSVGAGLDLRVTGGQSAATCGFRYIAPALVGQAPTLSAPITAGC